MSKDRYPVDATLSQEIDIQLMQSFDTMLSNKTKQSSVYRDLTGQIIGMDQRLKNVSCNNIGVIESN